jgi:hypothetical protein
MAGPARPTRVYVDTSVIGGCLDDEFRTASIRLFDRSRTLLVVSDINAVNLRAGYPLLEVRSHLKVRTDADEDF